MRASGQGHVDCMHLLILMGIDINIIDHFNMNAFTYAYYGRHDNCKIILIANGAKTDIHYDKENENQILEELINIGFGRNISRKAIKATRNYIQHNFETTIEGNDMQTSATNKNTTNIVKDVSIPIAMKQNNNERIELATQWILDHMDISDINEEYDSDCNDESPVRANGGGGGGGYIPKRRTVLGSAIRQPMLYHHEPDEKSVLKHHHTSNVRMPLHFGG
jgi:hypothetical protein